jgi:hypothetical protein
MWKVLQTAGANGAEPKLHAELQTGALFSPQETTLTL